MLAFAVLPPFYRNTPTPISGRLQKGSGIRYGPDPKAAYQPFMISCAVMASSYSWAATVIGVGTKSGIRQ